MPPKRKATDAEPEIAVEPAVHETYNFEDADVELWVTSPTATDDGSIDHDAQASHNKSDENVSLCISVIQTLNGDWTFVSERRTPPSLLSRFSSIGVTSLLNPPSLKR